MEYTCGPTYTAISMWAAPGHTRMTMFFVKLVMHPKSYIETTDRRDFGCKLSKWRWGRVLLWKIPEFCSMGGWVPKSGHVTITKIENLHIDTHRTIHWFHKCYSFLSTTKKKQNYRGKTVSEQWHRQALFVECLAILNWRSSSIRPSSFN